MKIFVLIIIFISLYLIYKIGFGANPEANENRDIAHNTEIDESEVTGKSYYILPDRSKPAQTSATVSKSDVWQEKANNFAVGNEKEDEIFDEEPDPDDLDIPPDEDHEPDNTDLEEESEDLQQSFGRDVELAEGLSIEEMTEVARAINYPADENAGLLLKVEKTDMFEKLVSGNEGKAARIKAVIDRHIRSQNPEVETEESNNEWKDFDMQNYLSKRIKK